MLTEAQYARLREESMRTGRSLGELIRNAIDDRHEDISDSERRRLLESAFGTWRGRSETGAEYVEHIRSGTARRLRDPA